MSAEEIGSYGGEGLGGQTIEVGLYTSIRMEGVSMLVMAIYTVAGYIDVSHKDLSWSKLPCVER